MPILNWIGKEKVINHHRDVPFRVLEHKYGFTSEEGETAKVTGSGNKIIHGDNLEALKALLPEYEGKINCIYIDPPYNTGNESWIYNDNVNDPKIQKWLKQVVGKEGEDLSRHDKWLCMMYPRLMMLHKLLSNDGAMFISIDDNEQANLKLMMDEIFGAGNFVANVIWQKKYAVANDHKTIAPMHDYVLVYQKSSNWKRGLLPRTEEKDKLYKFTDSKGLFRPDNYTCSKTAEERPNLYYSIKQPNTGEEIWPKRTRVWSYSKEQHQRHLEEDLIYWGKDGKSKVPSYKRYKSQLKNADGVVPQTWWPHDFASHTDSAKKELRSIFPNGELSRDFFTPKPTQLIKIILQIATDKDSIVLDSFSGSGTTAHSVLDLNQEDGGNRKFILVELEDYASSITGERVKRVINGYGDEKKQVKGTGGAFDYYELGVPIFIGNNDEYLNESLEIEKIHQYIWYSETRSSFGQVPISSGNKYYLGSKEDTAYYFVYDKNELTTLDYEFLASIKARANQYVIYADNCLLSKEYMAKHSIIFKKIPRDIARF